MLTSAIVTLAQKEFKDWSDEMIRTFLTEIQRMVYTQNATSQMRMYDSTTGLDPVLTTTAGTYEYNINTTAGFDVNAWRVYKVYSSDEDSPESVITYDATPSTAYAKVVFNADPGSSDYYVRCYRFPTSITSNSIQLEIPHAYHMSHVYPGLRGMIEMVRSGRSDQYEKFERQLLPDLVKKLSNSNLVTLFTPYRRCGV